MRASKEQADVARSKVIALRAQWPSLAEPPVEFDEVLAFINAAHRKLPTEAAFKRDSKRKRRRTAA